MIQYQKLTHQQTLVLSATYPKIFQDGNTVEQMRNWADYIQSCPGFQNIHEANQDNPKAHFKSDWGQAWLSGRFSQFYVCWANSPRQRSYIGFFGLFKEGGRALIGEYAENDPVPSYEERLDALREKYKAFWPNRIIMWLMLAMGLFGVFSDSGLGSLLWSLLVSGWMGFFCARDTKKYWLLHQPAINPLPWKITTGGQGMDL